MAMFMHKATARYNRVYFALLLSALAFVVAVNFAADPLGRFRLQDKIYFSAERELKPKLLAADHYEGLLLGSSKVTYIQPDRLGLSGKVLNAAFSAATPEEMYAFLLNNEPDVKWIGIGLDYYMFNENSFPMKDSDHAGDGVSGFGYLVSVDTLLYSIRSIRNRLQDRPVKYTSLGAENAVQREQQDMGTCCDYSKDLELLRTIHFHDFRISYRRLEILRQLQSWADERNISVIAWINPYNRAVYSLAERMIHDEMNQLRQALSGIFHHFRDLGTAYPSAEYYWKNDPYHYYPSTAELMFRAYLAGDISNAVAGGH